MQYRDLDLPRPPSLDLSGPTSNWISRQSDFHPYYLACEKGLVLGVLTLPDICRAAARATVLADCVCREFAVRGPGDELTPAPEPYILISEGASGETGLPGRTVMGLLDNRLLVSLPGAIADHEDLLFRKEVDTILNNAFDLVTVIDGDGYCLTASASFEKYFGVPLEQYAGSHVEELVQRGYMPKSVAALVFQTRKPQMQIQDTYNGHRLEVRSFPIFDEAGNLVRIYSFSKDITAHSLLRNRLSQTESMMKAYHAQLQELREQEARNTDMVARSGPMRTLLDLAHKAATVDSTILITGEAGTGKGKMARYIHDSGIGSSGPFLAINCSAFPEDLLELELFGHARGFLHYAPDEEKTGLVAAADSGTLLLDEISYLSLPLQAKIFAMLDSGVVYPLGSTRPVRMNARLIASTHRDLQSMISQGSFRQDLYYRLNVVPIHMPPLRERKEDIPLLIGQFLDAFSSRHLARKSISPRAVDAFMRYNWPGNIRQLENIIERLVVTTEAPVIDISHLPPELQQSDLSLEHMLPLAGESTLDEAVAVLEKNIILQAYRKYHRTGKVAEVLGQHRSTIIRKVNRYFEDEPELRKQMLAR